MKEVAVYFDVLRQRRQISQPDLAKMLSEDLTRNEMDINEVVGMLRAHPELIRPAKSLLAGADAKPQPGRKRKEHLG